MRLGAPHGLHPSVDALTAVITRPVIRAGSRSHRSAGARSQVCEDFGHLAQTAGLAVTYFDRYCSKTQLDSPAFIGFELAAIICILIAAKFLETRVPAIDELCTLSAKPRTRTTLKAAEMHVLNELGWDLHVTTPHIVLDQLLIIAAASPLCKKRADLLIDMSYHLYKILDYSPLTVAAAALLLSWNQYGDTQSEAKYTELLAQRCAPDLVRQWPFPGWAPALESRSLVLVRGAPPVVASHALHPPSLAHSRSCSSASMSLRPISTRFSVRLCERGRRSTCASPRFPSSTISAWRMVMPTSHRWRPTTPRRRPR